MPKPSKTSSTVNMLVLALTLLTACVSVPLQHGVPNLAQVEEGVWRGGQPTAEGWAYLRSLGVHTSIKLNPVSEGSDDLAISNNIAVLYFPISTIQQTLDEPKEETVYGAALSITNGTFVHCTKGEDRTGLVIGVYQVRVRHWTKEAAFKEMMAHGFHPMLRGLYSFWEDCVP